MHQQRPVFHLESGRLRALHPRPFRLGMLGNRLEQALQTLLAEYPRLLSVLATDPGPGEGDAVVLLGTEVPVEGGAVDLVLVDAAAVPIIVETKLSENPDMRRAVLGQILEYAAAAREAWSQGKLRQAAESHWQHRDQTLDDALTRILDDEADVTDFWDQVDQNLRSGRIRLVIAADTLPASLRRAIEMLNDQLTTIELLGLEVASYGTDDEGLVLVPNVIGQSQSVVDRKAPAARVWREPQLRTAYEEMEDRDLAEKMSRILDWALEEGAFMSTSAQYPGFSLRGSGGQRFISFMGNGFAFLYMDPSLYKGGSQERDRLVEALKTLEFFDPSLDPNAVQNGRQLRRSVRDLEVGEVDALLEVLREHCSTS